MFLIFGAKKIFTKLRQVFIEALILNYFDLEHYIQIKTNVSSYIISVIISQLVLNNLGQWHLMALFSKKMILTKIWYESHNGELLTIVRAFKIWKH